MRTQNPKQIEKRQHDIDASFFIAWVLLSGTKAHLIVQFNIQDCLHEYAGDEMKVNYLSSCNFNCSSITIMVLSFL